MRSSLYRPFLVAVAALVVFFTSLGKPYLWDEDEPKNAECAREMREAGNWVVPQFNYALRTDKPILLYWLMLTSYEVFGVNEFAARFWSAALAVGTCLLTYGIGRRLYGANAGLWSGLSIAACVMFAVSGRAATPDSTLIFCTTLSMFAFVRFGGVDRGALSRGGYLALYAASALAVLAKGPVGIVLPGGVWGLFLLCRTQQNAPRPAANLRGRHALMHTIAATLAPRRLQSVGRSLRPLTAILVLAAVALPWYVLVGIRTDGEWLAGFLGKHNVARFTGAMENHSGPIYYYLVAILVGFFPWSCFLGPAIHRLVQRLRSDEHADTRAADTFVACWAGLYVVFFSLARTKLPSYVLPCYPALALLVGAYLDEAVRRLAALPRFWYRAGLWSPVLVGSMLVIGLPIAASYTMPQLAWLGWIGVPLIVGGAAAVVADRRDLNISAPAMFAVTAIVFVTTLHAWAASRISQDATSPQLVAAARAATGSAPRLIGFRHFEPTLAFYAQSQVPLVFNAAELKAALARHPDACIVALDDDLADLRAALGTDPQIAATLPRLLRRNDRLILAVPASSHVADRSSDKTLR